MPLRTTVIGSYPKPRELDLPDWFQTSCNKKEYLPHDFTKKRAAKNKDFEALENKIVSEVITEQTDIGIDVVTDGELRRENYVFFFCRMLEGFDFEDLTYKVYRDGACKAYIPTVRNHITSKSDTDWCAEEWKLNQSMTTTPVKMTVPGPMTIINSTANEFYEDEKDLSEALVVCINKQVRGLAKAGCKYIQIDEPVLVRNVPTALEYGIEHLERCFEGVGDDVQKAIHLCCGYPYYLDQDDYEKADPECYKTIAKKLDNSCFDAISIEDSHRHNHLSLFDQFKKATIILGVIAIANSRVETVEEIQDRIGEVLTHIPKERLIIAPDCGMGFLPKNILISKLTNMVEAAKRF